MPENLSKSGAGPFFFAGFAFIQSDRGEMREGEGGVGRNDDGTGVIRHRGEESPLDWQLL